MPRFAPRLHVLLASDAPVGLVIRRGPSKSVATLLWDRRRDEFQLGQWLKGRIYERRSDLSPDGKYAIYYHRLLRDGWELVDRLSVGKWKDKDIFEKHTGKGWTLRKIAHAEIGAPVGKGCYWDEHELVGPAENQTIHCPAWEWADLDGKRLVWAANGKLCAAKVQKDRLAEEVELHDFDDMAFEAIEAPY